MNEWEKRATDFILGIILHLKTVNQINIISFCLGKRDTGSGPLYPWLWVFVKLYHIKTPKEVLGVEQKSAVFTSNWALYHVEIPTDVSGGKATRRVCRGQSRAAGLQRMTTSAIPQSLKKILLTSHTFLFNDKFDFTWGPQAIMFSHIRDSAEWQAERGGNYVWTSWWTFLNVFVIRVSCGIFKVNYTKVFYTLISNKNSNVAFLTSYEQINIFVSRAQVQASKTIFELFML